MSTVKDTVSLPTLLVTSTLYVPVSLGTVVSIVSDELDDVVLIV